MNEFMQSLESYCLGTSRAFEEIAHRATTSATSKYDIEIIDEVLNKLYKSKSFEA